MTIDLLSAVQAYKQYAVNILQAFASSADFTVGMEVAFGEGSQVSDLQESWIRGEPDFPAIEIRRADELVGALGVFAKSTNRIYLSQELLTNQSSGQIISVLLEEYGHYIDTLLNPRDFPGDEGEIFALLAQGKPLSEARLSELKTEDDSAVYSQQDGRLIEVEQSANSGFNPFYNLQTIAKIGDQGIQDISFRTSLNDNGKIAFSADLNTSIFGFDSVFVGDVELPSSLDRIAFNSSLQYGTGIQINNNGNVAVGWRTGTNSAIQIYDPASNSFSNIASGFAGFDADYFSILPTVSTNQIYDPASNSFKPGDVVFTAFRKEFDIFSASYVLGDPVLVVSSSPYEDDFSELNLAEEFGLTSGSSIIPMIADNGNVVARFGNQVNSPIRVYSNDLASFSTIADSSTFDVIGQAPGISDDGTIVVFYGEKSGGGEKGIFAAIDQGDNFRIEKIVDTSDGFSSFITNARVAVNATADDQRAVTITWMANSKTSDPNIDGPKGIYSARLNFFGSGSSNFNPQDPSNSFTVSRPSLVAEAGQIIDGLGTINDLNIYDPVNNRDRGEIAFWADTTGGDAIVSAVKQEVVFLDFNPQATSLPTEVKQILNSLGAKEEKWSGNTALALQLLRPDISLPMIQDKIVEQVQNDFLEVNANVKVLGRVGENAPTDGPYTRVYLGDSPFGPSTPEAPLGVTYSDPFNRDELIVNGKFLIRDS